MRLTHFFFDCPGIGSNHNWLWFDPFDIHPVVAPSANCTPVLVADGCFPAEEVKREFLKRSGGMESWLRDWVSEKIAEFAAGGAAAAPGRFTSPC
jgi:hypothetical protein